MQVIFLTQHGEYAPGEIHTIGWDEARRLIIKGVVSPA
jgi:hypothetical protein